MSEALGRSLQALLMRMVVEKAVEYILHHPDGMTISVHAHGIVADRWSQHIDSQTACGACMGSWLVDDGIEEILYQLCTMSPIVFCTCMNCGSWLCVLDLWA